MTTGAFAARKASDRVHDFNAARIIACAEVATKSATPATIINLSIFSPPLKGGGGPRVGKLLSAALTTRAEFEAVWDGELVLMTRLARKLFGDISLPGRDVDY